MSSVRPMSLHHHGKKKSNLRTYLPEQCPVEAIGDSYEFPENQAQKLESTIIIQTASKNLPDLFSEATDCKPT